MDKKPVKQRVEDRRTSLTIRVRDSAIAKLSEFGGRAGAGDLIEAAVNGRSVRNCVVLPDEVMEVLRAKCELVDTSELDFVIAAIKAFDLTPFLESRKSRENAIAEAERIAAEAAERAEKLRREKLPLVTAPTPAPTPAPVVPVAPWRLPAPTPTPTPTIAPAPATPPVTVGFGPGSATWEAAQRKLVP